MEGNPEDKWDATDWRHKFIAAFRKYGIVTVAAQVAVKGRTTVYEERKRNPEFELAWQEAEEASTDMLEAKAIQRATAEKNPSDTLLIFLLKARRPQKYRDNLAIQHSAASTPEGTAEELRAQAEALAAKMQEADKA